MNVELVLGNRKSGKSYYITDILSKHIDKNEICFFLVPEQSTLETESKLISRLKSNGLLDTQVVSFKKLGNLLLKNTDFRSKVFLNEEGQLLILNKIINDSNSELKYFKNAKASTIEEINKVINNIRDVDIKNFQDYNDIKKTELKLKLHDLEIIINKYKEHLDKGYIDEINFNDRILESISTSDKIRNSHFFIDDFYVFSNQQLNIIKELMLSAKTLTIALNIDINNVEFNQLGQGIYQKLYKFMEENDIPKKITTMNNQYFISKELGYLENILSNNIIINYSGKTNNLMIKKFTNIDEEVKNMFESIIKYIDQGYSYKDIKIICNNIDDYRNYFKLYRNIYEVPLFINEKISIHNHPISRCIISMLNLLDDFKTDDIFTLLKSGYLEFNMSEIEILEKYIKQNGINYNKWTKVFKEDIENEVIRKKIVDLVLYIRKKVNGKTVKDKITELYQILTKLKIYEQLSENIELYKESRNFKNVYINTQYWNALLEIFDQMVNFLGDRNISNHELQVLLKNSIERECLSILPINNNEVMVINSQDSFKESSKIVFVAGANEGYLPEKISREPLFPLDETLVLEKIFNWKKDELAKQLNRNMELYFSLTMASEKLIINYSLNDSKGEGIKPAYIIKLLKRIFNIYHTNKPDKIGETYFYSKNISLLNFIKINKNKKIEESKKNYENIFAYFGSFLDKLFEFIRSENSEGEINKEEIKKILFSDKEPLFTISKLEEYGKCPYSFFIKYGIKPTEEREYELKSMDIGNIYHHVLEAIGNNNWYLEKEDFTQEIIANHFDKEYLENNFLKFDSYQFTYRLNKIKEEGLKLVAILQNDIINSKFIPSFYEVEFGLKKTFPEYKLFLNSKDSISIEGKIDRVDILKVAEKEFVRIIDYKLKGKKIDYRKVRDGIEFQMFVYLNALAGINYQPAGVIYSRLIDDSNNKNRLTGLAVKNEEIDILLPDGFKDSNTIDTFEYNLIKKFTEDKIKEHANSIIEGNFKVAPYYYKNDEKGCTFCKYSKICKNKNINRVLLNKKFDKSLFIEELNNKYAKLD